MCYKFSIFSNTFSIIKKILVTLFIFCSLNFFAPVHAQNTIETRAVFKQKTTFDFTNEWQYLSSDLYFFNTNKFNNLINSLNIGSKKKRRRRRNAEYVNYLFISANIKDLKFFGGDLTYPIFNFKVSVNDKNNYKTHVSNSSEVIRIIDNLPLASSKDYIDAVIQTEAITNKKSNRIYSIISQQLKNISKITSPSAAILSLVGEFGKFMDSKAMGKQYKFSSTIRLYEMEDFDKQLHSINVYVFTPSNVTNTGFRADTLKKMLDSSEIMTISREFLSKTIKYNVYPYIVIVNYKSKYESQPVIGDEVNFKSIEARRIKVTKAYEDKLINKESYIQEIELINFLDIFAKFKLNINNYELNYKNKITEDFSKSFYVILRKFRKLKITFNNRKLEYYKNSSFNNEFKIQYSKIIQNAEIYLDIDNNLKSIKELVNIMFEFEKNPDLIYESSKRETMLRKLYAVELPDSEKNSEEIKQIKKYIIKIEKKHYNEIYKRKVNRLNAVSVNENSLSIKNDLQKSIVSTSCKLCLKKVNESISTFDLKYKKFKLEKLKDKYVNQKNITLNELFKIYKKRECINTNLKKHYPDTIPFHIKIVKDELLDLDKLTTALLALTKTDISMLTYEKVNNKITNTISLTKKANSKLKNICAKLGDLCECKD